MTLVWLVGTLAGLLGLQVPAAPTAVPSVQAVTGVVVDSRTSQPIGGVRVTLVEAGAEQLTSADGRFAFASVAPGSHTLAVSTIGYIFVRRRIVVEAGQPLDLSVRLAEGTGTYEEDVTVAATPTLDPGTTSIELGSGALQDLRGVAADDPVRAVQALPGVATGDDFQAQFSVRGSAYRHVGIVTDGTPTALLFHSVHGTEDTGSIAMINSDVLARATLSTGPHPQRHGDWLGATLEFDMREGSRDRMAMRTAVSGTSASFVAEGPLTRAKRGSWLLSVRKSYVDWLVRKLDSGIEGTIGFVDSQAKLAYDLSARQQVQFTLVAGDAAYLDTTASSANQIYRATSTSALASLLWRYAGDHILLTHRVSYARNRFLNTGVIGQEQASGHASSWIARTDVTAPWKYGLTAEGGLKAEHQNTDQSLRNLAYQGASRIRIVAEQPVAGSRNLVSLWGQVTKRAARGSVAAGFRTTGDTLTDDTSTALWVLGERSMGRLRFTASAARVMQVPLIESVQQSVSSIAAERARLVDAGVGHALTTSIRWSVTAFHRRESDVLRRIEEDRLVGPTRVFASRFPLFSSSLEGTSRGFDLLLERKAATGPTGWFSYTWAHTRHHDRVTGERFDADFDQRHTMNAFIQQRLSYRLKVSAKLRVGSNFPIVGYFTGTPPDALFLGATRNSVRLPRYTRLDLNASRTFTFARSRLTLFVEVMNATGRRNYGMADGSIRSTLQAVDYVQRLIPLVPSAGVLLEF